jgi:hypothetical protein
MTEGNGAGRIYWVGGSKGGVGKSMMTGGVGLYGARVLLLILFAARCGQWPANLRCSWSAIRNSSISNGGSASGRSLVTVNAPARSNST